MRIALEIPESLNLLFKINQLCDTSYYEIQRSANIPSIDKPSFPLSNSPSYNPPRRPRLWLKNNSHECSWGFQIRESRKLQLVPKKTTLGRKSFIKRDFETFLRLCESIRTAYISTNRQWFGDFHNNFLRNALQNWKMALKS